MITAVEATKRFDDIVAVDHINATIRDGSVFGLIGSNGAGKSTFLRMIAGVLKPDEGDIHIDGTSIYEMPAVKSRCFFISDEQYFFQNSTPAEMRDFYRMMYPAFDLERFRKLMAAFDLDENRKIRTFSKGMKKQVSVICGVCARTDYLLCDETFDGLDPVARQAVKGIFAEDVCERGLTPIVASHNRRELEDICDWVGIIHKGKMILEKPLDDLKGNVHKYQVVLLDEFAAKLPEMENILHISKTGSVFSLIVKGDPKETDRQIKALTPILCERVSLTLEEVFIYELGGLGYDFKNIII